MEQKSSEQIITRIHDAANELVFTYGVKGWNMDDCAAEAGITKRTLYKYMNSKELLIEQVLLSFIQKTQNDLSKDLAQITDFSAGIKRIIRIFPGMIMKLDSRIVQDVFRTYPEIEAKVISEREAMAAEVLDFIQKWKKKGIVKEPVEPEVILEIIQSLIIYYLKSNPDNFEVKLREGLQAVLYGIIS